jgi:hypothetical protein
MPKNNNYRVETLDSFYNEWGHEQWADNEAAAVELANEVGDKQKLPARVIHDGKIIYLVNV